MKFLASFLNWCWAQKFYLVFFYFVILVIWSQWFVMGNIIAGGDYLPPLNPWGLINKVLYSWSPDYLGTESFMEGTKLIPYYLFWGIFDLLGVSHFIVERLWFIFLNLVAGFGLLYFFRIFFPKLTSIPAKLTAVLFYLFNLAIVTEFNHDTALFAYYSLPLVVGVFVNALRRRNLKSLAYFVLASTFFIAAAANPGIFITIIGVLLGFFIGEFYEADRSERKRIFKFALVIAGAFILLNAFWIFTTLVPLFEVNVISPFSESQSSRLNWDWVVQKSGRSSFLNLFTFLAKFSWDSAFFSDATFPYAPVYSDWWLILSTAIVPAFALFAVFASRKEPFYRRTLWILGFLLFFVFLAKGAHSPLPEIFHFFFDQLPGFKVFREPYTKLIVVLPFFMASLLCIAGQSFFSFAGANWRKFLALGLLLLVNFSILLNAWPLLFGEQTLKSRVSLADDLTEFPQYWFDATDYINQENENITSLYVSPPRDYYYKWGYAGHPIDRRLVFVPRVQARGVFSSFEKGLLLERYERALVEEDLEKFKSFSNLLRIDAVLHRNDIDWIWNTLFHSRSQNQDVVKDPNIYQNFLSLDTGLVKRKAFKDLFLFQRGEGGYGFVSVPENVVYFTSSNPMAALAYLDFHPFEDGDIILFEDDLNRVPAEQLERIKEKVDVFIVSPKSTRLQIKQAKFDLAPADPAVLEVPVDGSYDVLIRKGGTLTNVRNEELRIILNPLDGSGGFSVDENVFSVGDSEDHKYLKITSINIPKGDYALRIIAQDKLIAPLSFDDLFLMYKKTQKNELQNSLVSEKLNPTQFNVDLGALPVGSFFLTLHQTYTSKWKLQGIDGKFAPHFKSNFYANTWFVDLEKAENRNFVFVYSLQKYFAVFLLISGFMIVFSFLYLFVNIRKR